jgi:hypothetical protein
MVRMTLYYWQEKGLNETMGFIRITFCKQAEWLLVDSLNLGP